MPPKTSLGAPVNDEERWIAISGISRLCCCDFAGLVDDRDAVTAPVPGSCDANPATDRGGMLGEAGVGDIMAGRWMEMRQIGWLSVHLCNRSLTIIFSNSQLSRGIRDVEVDRDIWTD